MAFSVEKLTNELGLWFTTFKHPPPATHKGGALVNRFVEACRASPYAAGHLGAAATLLIVATCLLVWLK